MSNSWSKEDRFHYQKSEVFQELEKGILDTIKRADILQQKIAQEAKTPVPTDADIAKVKEFGEAMKDAGLAAQDDEVAEDSLDAEPKDLQNEVVNDLRDLVTAALSEGNLKLAYRIERTIDEILEQEVVCE
jgi:hypothetical protein